MMKFTAPPAFMVAWFGISSWLLRSLGDKLGNLSSSSTGGGPSAGPVCHCPKLTVALLRGPSAPTTKEVVRPRATIAIREETVSLERFILFPPRLNRIRHDTGSWYAGTKGLSTRKSPGYWQRLFCQGSMSTRDSRLPVTGGDPRG